MAVIVLHTEITTHPDIDVQKTHERIPMGDSIITRSGVLEVKDLGVTIKAFAPGNWDEAWIEK